MKKILLKNDPIKDFEVYPFKDKSVDKITGLVKILLNPAVPSP